MMVMNGIMVVEVLWRGEEREGVSRVFCFFRSRFAISRDVG